MVEARNMAVARTEHGGAIEQRFRFDLPAVPEQVEPLGEIGLRKAWIELERHIERCQRFVILMGQAQGASKCAVAKAIELIECDRMAPLAQRRFQPRRAISGLVDKRALQIDVAERTMAACKVRVGVDRALEIGFGRVEPRRGKPP